jgi:hypothetical protein
LASTQAHNTSVARKQKTSRQSIIFSCEMFHFVGLQSNSISLVKSLF